MTGKSKNKKDDVVVVVKIFRKKKTTREEIRRKVISEIVKDLLGHEITTCALLDKINQSMRPQQRLANSKQLGLYLKKVLKEERICLKKKVMFVEPKTSLISYSFQAQICKLKKTCEAKEECKKLNS